MSALNVNNQHTPIPTLSLSLLIMPPKRITGKKVIPPSPTSSTFTPSPPRADPPTRRRSGMKTVRHAADPSSDEASGDDDNGEAYGGPTPQKPAPKKKPALGLGRKLTTISAPPPPAAPGTPSRVASAAVAAGLAAQSPATRKRLSVINRIASGAGMPGAGALGALGEAGVSREVMNNNFEEWMKMATDNVSWRHFVIPLCCTEGSDRRNHQTNH